MGLLDRIFGSSSQQFPGNPPTRSQKTEDAFEKRRIFRSPYDPSTIAQLITATYDLEVLPEAPIIETVYYSEKTENRIVFTGGNRLTTHWNIIMEVEPEGTGTRGTLYVDRPKSDVNKWLGNVIQIIPNLHMTLASAGTTFENWDATDIFR
ncbi:hypothetical protein [Arthrobacter sp. OY3WO11]|uniref:hypothetical protein n=1 Tax=Arthrobacter sp. OY3WO11 TaxID=1835723 RepID=UPI0007CF7816|nr:hypothetical protein [Arthrobacter sp. OY3WO11]OAD97744.1 hypothetical protein A6A22_20290 [Arthrobacter sp. OY3WO11]